MDANTEVRITVRTVVRKTVTVAEIARAAGHTVDAVLTTFAEDGELDTFIADYCYDDKLIEGGDTVDYDREVVVSA